MPLKELEKHYAGEEVQVWRACCKCSDPRWIPAVVGKASANDISACKYDIGFMLAMRHIFNC